MMEHKFERGQLIVPNDDLTAAFKYDPENTELLEHVEYRIATSAEFIWHSKNIGMTPVDRGLEAYKSANADKVGNVYRSIEKQNSNIKKHGLS